MTGAQAAQRTTISELGGAVHRAQALSREGVLERLFTLAFRGLVYPQIWEDPVIDMEALALQPEDRVITIASGGCNAMSYLTAGPRSVLAVDLNGAHIALTRLKQAAAQHLPDYESFLRLFGRADDDANVAAYDKFVAPALDPQSRAYWEARTLRGRRIALFSRGFYRHGLLGRFIGLGHMLARLYGVDPRLLLKAKNREEQRDLFDAHIAPIFDRPMMRWLLRQPASLYGLGIPPAQYRTLHGGRGMDCVVRERLSKLACDFDLRANYFAWQAFARGYCDEPGASMPPYLMRENFQLLRARADRLSVAHGSVTTQLRAMPAGALDAYVLLDAQDWMNDQDLTALWGEITRTARPGARVIFRTAADERLLPGRIPDTLLDAWRYDEERCRALGARDRSSIYGGFHLYTLKEGPR